ncbi:MAG: hypothetical protein IKH28_09500 [Lachnospiraceae bacterium]|nr:hypothetical protein [Lachnospiraceae bacterium]
MVTYRDISIRGVDYMALLELNISQKICEHAAATLKLLVDSARGQEFVSHATERTMIQIVIRGTNVFSGALSDARLSVTDEGMILILKIRSLSILLDSTCKKRSFQEIGITHAALMQKILDGAGSIIPNFQDKPTEGIVIQYQETDWNLIRRLALGLNSFVTPCIHSSSPVICIGVAQSTHPYFDQAGCMVGNEIIFEAHCELKGGRLISKCKKVPLADLAGYFPASYKANPVVGKVFAGVVMAVRDDAIQAHITDIDSAYEAGNWWFPYSTIYSSPANGAGIYCMPLEGEAVRLFFPSANPAEAFAAGSVNQRDKGPTTKDKVFTSPEGMGVMFYEGGLVLYDKDRVLFINLSEEGGITIHSNENIACIAKDNFFVKAAGSLSVISDKEVYMGAKGSFIELNADNGGSIDFHSADIYVV